MLWNDEEKYAVHNKAGLVLHQFKRSALLSSRHMIKSLMHKNKVDQLNLIIEELS
jgi:hypothetical protein